MKNYRSFVILVSLIFSLLHLNRTCVCVCVCFGTHSALSLYTSVCSYIKLDKGPTRPTLLGENQHATRVFPK